jgi:DNA-binding transcriptional ArsR family regulator
LPTEVGKANRSNDDELLAALGHPLRRRILRALEGEEATSPRQLSATLQAPLSVVSYHVQVLAECAAVTLVSTTTVRGAIKHFYSAEVDAPWAREVLGLADPEDADRGESPGAAGT